MGLLPAWPLHQRRFVSMRTRYRCSHSEEHLAQGAVRVERGLQHEAAGDERGGRNWVERLDETKGWGASKTKETRGW